MQNQRQNTAQWFLGPLLPKITDFLFTTLRIGARAADCVVVVKSAQSTYSISVVRSACGAQHDKGGWAAQQFPLTLYLQVLQISDRMVFWDSSYLLCSDGDNLYLQVVQISDHMVFGDSSYLPCSDGDNMYLQVVQISDRMVFWNSSYLPCSNGEVFKTARAYYSCMYFLWFQARMFLLAVVGSLHCLRDVYLVLGCLRRVLGCLWRVLRGILRSVLSVLRSPKIGRVGRENSSSRTLPDLVLDFVLEAEALKKSG